MMPDVPAGPRPVTITPDPERYAAVVQRERATLIGTVIVVVVAEAVTSALGLLGPIIVAHGLTLVAAFYFFSVLRFRRNRMAQTLGDTSRGITVSDAGVDVPVLGTVAWQEIVAVFTVVDQDRADRYARSRGIRGIAERWTQSVGSANHYLTIAVADGPGLRQRVDPPRYRRWVKLWARSGAPDFGAIQLIGDSYYTDADADLLDRTLRAFAAARGLPASRTANMLEQGEFFRTNSGIAVFDGRSEAK